MTHTPAILALADGTVFEGISVGAPGERVGELVFNTAMTGYQEILTDPSYAGQVVMLTGAHVGNTGCNLEDMESNRAFAAGLVMRECTFTPSNYRATQSLPEWLIAQGVPGISGIDTRALVLRLRNEGAMAVCLSTSGDKARAVALAQGFAGLSGSDLARAVTCETPRIWQGGRGEWASSSEPATLKVVAYDFGVKHTILRILSDLGCEITLVPAQTPAKEVLAMNPHGVFLSNGPGDPAACTYAIEATRTFLDAGVPVFGICLGFQILALACGAQTLKMKFGHHGANHPVAAIHGETARVLVTSQNHGFAVDAKTLPDCLEATHHSLFDGSLQGIRHRSKPAFGFQGHPESSPGPHDAEVLFGEFITHCRARAAHP
ncbi:carbamoyl phosphate synthase, small subunit [Legionella geestiana]|uniref:Carbamoyl phosphate synthase small chain n=1 Tax=Legionella geestiana TaxID=45065 RepID=A0A0W0TT48_9GAMM|nr:glutamine-hydrolyzing carbamoyl-phosphate synthase small subunit [Legionella geestiana]KTC98850.1 carbamoyl phosphate synthase, small subunit [Legionella geestiana]QBS12759.1 carbamoyl-phosphate synthase small subunit [Legionella geestiana]QDQ39524.1 glutamine-hydrolyzing carbamoyl-phosphate synthase small subunit [Legionella geestiana]STX54768.1 carbamoyl phosphate synthase, small subunit [Legionella geestiana]